MQAGRVSREKFFSYVRPQFGTLVAAVVLTVPVAALSFSPAPGLKYLTDHVLVAHEPGAVRRMAGAILFAAAVNLIFRFSSGYLIRAAAAKTTQKIRDDLFSHLLHLSLGYFSEARGGILVGRVINDVQTLSRFLTNLVDMVKDPLIFLSLLGYAFWLHWKLALVTCAVLPVAALILANSGRHAKRYSHRILGAMAEMSAALGETLSGMRVIQAFSLEPYLNRRFQRINRDCTRTSVKAIRMEALAGPGVELIFGLVMTGLIYFAGHEALRGRMSPGDVIAFFTCFGMMLAPLKSLNDLNLSYQQSMAAMENIVQLLEQKADVVSPAKPKSLPGFSREVRFERVSFAYPGSEGCVLRELTFSLQRGEVVALVGASGAGKSTVLNLLPRFVDPREGAVRLDGVDLREFALQDLRKQVALVTQEVFLFHDTVRANLRGVNLDVGDAELIAAAKSARAWDFIERLPEGLETVIGDRGQKLSGGERQRLSIARAILKNAPILLLDEATSALDSENERLVQDALNRLLAGRTALVVAHRLSTIRRANRILVMDKGRIVEEGNHETLLARGGAYAQALQLQGGS